VRARVLGIINDSCVVRAAPEKDQGLARKETAAATTTTLLCIILLRGEERERIVRYRADSGSRE
jgi:hypothetical protein